MNNVSSINLKTKILEIKISQIIVSLKPYLNGYAKIMDLIQLN